MNDKVFSCLWGLAVGEALSVRSSRKDGDESPVRGFNAQLASMTVVSAISSKDRDIWRPGDGFAKTFSENLAKWGAGKDFPENLSSTCIEVAGRIASGRPWDSSGIEEALDSSCVARNCPLGPWAESVGIAAEYAIWNARITHPNEMPVSAAAAAAVISKFAADGVPTGQWAAKAIEIVSVNRDFVDALSLASSLAASRTEPESVTKEAFLDNDELAVCVVGRALYCCMSMPDSFADPVALAAGMKGGAAATTALVGAWMGARLGAGSIPEGWKQAVDPGVLPPAVR